MDREYEESPYVVKKNFDNVKTHLERYNNPSPLVVVVITIVMVLIVLVIYFLFLRTYVTGRWYSQVSKEEYYIFHDKDGSLQVLTYSTGKKNFGVFDGGKLYVKGMGIGFLAEDKIYWNNDDVWAFINETMSF
jgi:hypothetical protein